MHLIEKLFVAIIFSILNFKIACTLPCCKNNGTIMNLIMCKDGTPINVPCEPYWWLDLLSPNWDDSSSFNIGYDAQGEYLDAYVAGYVIREPYFCTGFKYYRFTRRTLKVAITCPFYRDWHYDRSLNGTTEAKPEGKNARMYSIFGGKKRK